jgi:hypothetical protein
LGSILHTDYGTNWRIAEIQAIGEKYVSPRPRTLRPVTPSLYVKEGVTRATCRWGMSGSEIRYLSDAAHFLNRLDLPLWYAVLAAHHLPEFETRAHIRKFKSDLVLYQQRAELDRRYWLEALEGEPTVHSNILFPLPAHAAQYLDTLRRSTIYGAFLDIRRADGTDWFVSYVSKERTPQAHFAARGRHGPRLPGSHPLGAGGGDRVRLSKDLEAALTQERLITPRQRTYAARSLPRPPASVSTLMIPPGHQYSLFDDLPPMLAPARQEPHPLPRANNEIRLAAQGDLPLAYEPDITALMRRLGPTHSDIAAKIGRSRAQVTNIIVGRFGPSRTVVQRVLELTKAA